MKIICFLSFLFFSFTASSSDSDSIQCIAKYAVDHHSRWERTDLENQSFQPLVEHQNVNIGYNLDAAVWCNFEIENLGNSYKTVYLCFQNNHLDSLQFFDGNEVQILGDRTHFSSPYLINQTFEFHLLPHQRKSVVVRIKKGISFLDFSFSLGKLNHLRDETQGKIALISFFGGIVSLLLLFIGILFLVTRKKVYFFYVLYSSLTLIYVLVTTGFAKYFLLPEYLHFSEWRIYSASLWFIALGFFLSEFLDLKKTQKRKYRAILLLNLINLSVILFTLALLQMNRLDALQISMNLGYIIFILVIVLIVWATISHFKINRLNATYILLSFLPHTVWALMIILKSFKIIQSDLHVDWLVFISLYEVFLFGYVLARNYIEAFQKNNVLTRDILLEKEKSIVAIGDAQVRERKQIANILHDSFGSKLAHISHLLEMRKIDQMRQNLTELSHEIRNVSHQIMPKALEDGALVSSLKTQIEILDSATDCKIVLFDFEFPEMLDNNWVLNMYLTSLELIHNALKHAKPTQITLEFFAYEDVFVFQYIDDGEGFDADSIPKGFGLSTIESRIKAINGKLEINSKKGEGSVIQILIPVE